MQTPAPKNDEAFEALIRRHGPFLQRLALALSSDQATADDLVHETWLTALLQRPLGMVNERSWLATVLRRRAGAKWKQRAKALGVRHSLETGDERSDPAAIHLVLERERLVAEAVADVAEPYRTALFLRYREELSPTAISERTGLPLKTVKTQLRRGLRMLRVKLERTDADGDRPGGAERWLGLTAFFRRSPTVVRSGSTGALKALGPALVVTLALGLVAGVWIARQGSEKNLMYEAPLVQAEARGAAPARSLAEILPATVPSALDWPQEVAQTRTAVAPARATLRLTVENATGAPVRWASVWIGASAIYALNATDDEFELRQEAISEGLLSDPALERGVGFQILRLITSARPALEGHSRLVGYSDAAGRIELTDWPANRPVRLMVAKEGFGMVPFVGVADESSTAPAQRIQLSRTQTLKVKVIDEGGRRIVGAGLKLVGPTGSHDTATTSSGGTAVLQVGASGRQCLELLHPVRRTVLVEENTLAERETVTIRIPRPHWVTVGFPSSPLAATLPAAARWVVRGADGARVERSAATGVPIKLQLGPGRALAQVMVGDAAIGSTQFDVPTDRVSVDLDDDLLAAAIMGAAAESAAAAASKGPSARARARSPLTISVSDGERPVIGAMVQVLDYRGPSFGNWPKPKDTDAEGRVAFDSLCHGRTLVHVWTLDRECHVSMTVEHGVTAGQNLSVIVPCVGSSMTELQIDAPSRDALLVSAWVAHERGRQVSGARVSRDGRMLVGSASLTTADALVLNLEGALPGCRYLGTGSSISRIPKANVVTLYDARVYMSPKIDGDWQSYELEAQVSLEGRWYEVAQYRESTGRYLWSGFPKSCRLRLVRRKSGQVLGTWPAHAVAGRSIGP